jgi:hypothetical protein
MRFLVLACHRHYPGGIRTPKSFSRCPDGGLPHLLAGSAPALGLSRPARRSLALRPANSLSRQAALSIEGFNDIVTSIAAPIATGWNDSCRAGIAPAENARLSRRTRRGAGTPPQHRTELNPTGGSIKLGAWASTRSGAQGGGPARVILRLRFFRRTRPAITIIHVSTTLVFLRP